MPTDAEWQAEVNSWNSLDADGAYGSPLKPTVGGYRYYADGNIYGNDSHGAYWSSTIHGTDAKHLEFDNSTVNRNSYYRSNGFSVRCIKD